MTCGPWHVRLIVSAAAPNRGQPEGPLPVAACLTTLSAQDYKLTFDLDIHHCRMLWNVSWGGSSSSYGGGGCTSHTRKSGHMCRLIVTVLHGKRRGT